MSEESMTNATEASAEVVHKAKNLAQAVETTREIQLNEAVEKTALRTKDALLEGLKEVFGDGDGSNPKEMRVLVHRIPILCTNFENMRQDMKNMKDNQTWQTRIVVGLFIAAVAKVVFSP